MTLAPEVQEALAEYQKVTAILDALLTLTEQDWQRWEPWQVCKHDVTMPLWYWQRALENRLRAWGIDPAYVPPSRQCP